MDDNKYHINLVLVFIAIIALPALQTVTRLLPENKLNGVVPATSLPELTWDNWYHFRYQPVLNDLVEKKFGFRTSFVRLYNQVDYSLFRQPHGSGVVIGKDGYLFEEWFITSHFGNDYAGEEKINLNLRYLKQINSYFNHLGKKFAIVIAPGKAGFYPEYIPRFMTYEYSTTNYEGMVSGIQATEIPLLDFNKWFLELKNSSECALFPKTGTHWSLYGSALATDSLSGFLAELLGRPLPEIHVSAASPVDTLIYPDNDLEQVMNLVFPMKNHPMCYPQISSQPEDGFNLPNAVVIGDSFFWGMFNYGLTGRIFKDVEYWYYNSTIYHKDIADSVKASQLPFPEAFMDKDLIILMCNPSNIHNIGWGFLERASSELFNPEWQREYEKMVREYIQAIHNTPEWENQIRENARERGLPADSLIEVNAKYMVEQYLLTHDLF
jgi:hypothetical protein